MYKLIIPVLLVLVAISTTGCGANVQAEPFNPASIQGQVDTSLSPQQQALQRGMQAFLNAVQEGAGDQAGLSLSAPVDFRDPFPSFFGTSARLVRWDFNGPPVGNEVPVTLYFDDRTAGPVDPTHELREERTYYVVPAGQRFTIGRKL